MSPEKSDRHNNENKGLTLVEMMIVISIVGIATAVAIPNLSSNLN